MPWWILERAVRMGRHTKVAARGLSPSRTLRRRSPPGFEHRLGSAMKYSQKAGAHCAQRRCPSVQPPVTAQTTDLLPSCQCIFPALIWGSVLMLALAQLWFLWQLQRQMQGCFQLRYHQLRYPKLFLPNHRQIVMQCIRTDPAVTVPGGHQRQWSSNMKMSSECSFMNNFQLFPCCAAPRTRHSLPQQCVGCCLTLMGFRLLSLQPCSPTEAQAGCFL